MSKDTIKVNMNIYDIPILVEQLKKLEQENKQLQQKIDKAKEYIETIKNATHSSARKEFAKMILINYELLENLLTGDKENE